MKKYKRENEGFTIVELIIVIAVISILSSLLIPVFSGLIEKSKVSKDKQLIHSLNIALITNEAISTNTQKLSMHEILTEIEQETNINKNNIYASSSGDILYDSINNRFLLTDKNNNVIYHDNNKSVPNINNNSHSYWKIYDGVNEKLETEPKFSIYWNSEKPFSLTEISVGLDMGSNEKETEIKYINNDNTIKEIIIRTNTGSLEIDGYVDSNGNGDTIYHYGTANEINIINVGNASYHEYGYSLTTTVHNGHYIAEAGSKTIILNILSTTQTSAIVKSDSQVLFAKNESNMVIMNKSNSEITNILSESEQDNCLHNFEIIENFNNKICKNCGKVIDSDHEHIFNEYEKVDNQIHKRTCSICNTIETSSHTEMVIAGTSATCTSTGLTDKVVCSDCNYVITEAETIDMLDHSFGDYISIDKVKHKLICGYCGHTETSNHTEKVIAGTSATCTSTGLTDKVVCSDCNYVITEAETIDMLDHSFGDYIIEKDSTCSELGLQFRSCEMCEDKIYEYIMLKPHDYYLDSTSCVDCGYAKPNKSHKHNWICMEEDITTNTRTCYCECGLCGVYGTSTKFLKLLNSISDENNTISLDMDYNFSDEEWDNSIDLSSYLTDKETVITIDGNGHTIYNLINNSENAGLFAEISTNVIIKNLNIIGGTITSTSTGNAGVLVGSITAGELTIKNCVIENVKVSDGKYVGGLVGHSTVSSVTLSGNELNYVKVSGKTAGGVVGYSEKKITIKSISGTNNNVDGTTIGKIIGQGKSTCSITSCTNFKTTQNIPKDIGKTI